MVNLANFLQDNTYFDAAQYQDRHNPDPVSIPPCLTCDELVEDIPESESSNPDDTTH